MHCIYIVHELGRSGDDAGPAGPPGDHRPGVRLDGVLSSAARRVREQADDVSGVRIRGGLSMETMKRELSSVAAAAAEIRAGLKKAFPGVKFSVRSDNYSMGSSINVKWVDGPTPKAVEKIAHAHERIDRDSYSGEILSGGN